MNIKRKLIETHLNYPMMIFYSVLNNFYLNIQKY